MSKASLENGVMVVKALFSFTGKNNDELCFKKGDTVIITQKEEGGWWEGTLDDNTGWFPSNYVREIGQTDCFEKSKSQDMESPPLSPQQSQTQLAYHNMVTQEVLDSEKAHLNDLQNIYSKYLIPLKNSDILTESEYVQLTTNFEEILSVHGKLLLALESEAENGGKEQKIGGVFLKMAPLMQSSHKLYISNHPKAVCVIEKYRESLNTFLESLGCTSPGTLSITTFLSTPFRRLDKYPALLQEAHRHTEDDHPDRGDRQRSAHVYRDLSSACGSIRRQKQLELEVVTNKVNGWEGGESLSVLGAVVHMRSVALLPDNRDRYLVLFHDCLVLLALSPRASSFIFEGKYLLCDLRVVLLEDLNNLKNAFELTGTHMERIVAVCQSRTDQHQWVDILNSQIMLVNSQALLPSLPAHASPKRKSSLQPSSHIVCHESPVFSPSKVSQSAGSNKTILKPWSLNCLRPSPPVRPDFPVKDDKKKIIAPRKKDDRWYEDDTLILRVIEAYCTSAKSRHTVNSNSVIENSSVTSPTIVCDREKIIVEEKKGDEIVHEERSLIDTVYSLRDQMSTLTQHLEGLRADFEEERRATQRLKSIVNKMGGSDLDFDIQND